MDQTQRYEETRKRVKDLKEFYVHALVYVLVNVGLFALDAFTPGVWWFFWPLLGWGVGLGVHGATVFGAGLGRGWEERKVREIMDRER